MHFKHITLEVSAEIFKDQFAGITIMAYYPIVMKYHKKKGKQIE